ncbi:MAG: EVE domain-containing protein [Oscillatoriales cyanobacterium]|nr:MAG: EVE domain-containing protein [Oscillatoriales cyanobacterium]
MTHEPHYWLTKSEPSDYSIEDLQRDRTEIWDGVRNYQARNFLRAMQIGDYAFFYHSNVKPPAIVGLMRVVEAGIIDPSQFDSGDAHYDPKATPEKPRWFTVRFEFVEKFPQPLTLERLKVLFTPAELWVVKQGNRLSVMPVETPIATQLLTEARG